MDLSDDTATYFIQIQTNLFFNAFLLLQILDSYQIINMQKI